MIEREDGEPELPMQFVIRYILILSSSCPHERLWILYGRDYIFSFFKKNNLAW